MDGSDHIHEMLGKMDGKLDALLESKSDHEARLRSLEKLRWLLHGMWVVLSAGIAYVAHKL